MEQDNINFRKLIEHAIALAREGCEHAKTSPDFVEAMQMVHSKQARIDLRISFNPVPCVTAELVREDDGEVIGHIFQHQARAVWAN